MTSTSDLVKRRFSEELTRCCGSYYRTVPSNEQFARDLYLSSKYALKVSRETVRKWFKGDSFPDLDHLMHLIDWLGLDMSNVFDVSDSDKHQASSLSDSITVEQVDALAQLLSILKDSDFSRVCNRSRSTP